MGHQWCGGVGGSIDQPTLRLEHDDHSGRPERLRGEHFDDRLSGQSEGPIR